MRIRSIKPEFWRSDDITALPISARLTFIGLWSYVDDNGVGADKIVSIVADLYADDFSRDPQETLKRVSDDLRRLASGGQVVRYRAVHNGSVKDLLYVTQWKQHQVVNHPSKGHQYPVPPAEMVAAAMNLPRLSGDSLETLTHEQGNRGTGEQGKGAGEQTCATSLRDRTPSRFDEFWAAYPRRRDRRKAEKAFTNALKRADPDAIIAGAHRYATDPNRMEQYTKYAEGWLNGDCWLDEPLPPRNGHVLKHKMRTTLELAAQQEAQEREQLKAVYPLEIE